VAALAIAAAPAAELPEGFRLEPVVGGLTNPADLAGTPDGRILIAERTTGDLRVLHWGLLQSDPICSVPVDATGEGGLLGVAVHPEFAANGWVYLYYTELTSAANKVERYTLGRDSCWGAIDIVSDLGSASTGTRNGGGIDFGPDGKLYIATGDVETQANGQDPLVLQGKVLRLNDDGSIPADNPDPASAVYAVGVRDGRGLTVNPAGQVYLADGGDNLGGAHDELNLAGAGGNLGWADESGSGGIYDQPLVDWLPTVGIQGVTDYDGILFPNLDGDGLDNDHDSLGPDGGVGALRVDDNNRGECIGSGNNGNPCTNNLDCLPIRSGESVHYCEKIDDVAEYCPEGVPFFDDDCDNVGEAGIDEPDESYLLDVFTAGSAGILRATLTGAQDQLSSWSAFLDSNALPDCPTGWTGMMTGRDGHLYALATNGGGPVGGLYRIVYDGGWGPREVSAPGSYVPLHLSKMGSSAIDLFWEDIREDAMQPQDNGSLPTGMAREYTVWRGTLGTWYSHEAVADGIEGTAVNEAVRKQTLLVEPSRNYYFLVSARSDNYEGTLGNSTAEERPGFEVRDICETLGEWAPSNGWAAFACGRDFTLLDTKGRERHAHEFRGKAVLLDFSAEWCPPCNTEADALEDIWQEYKDRNVQIVSIIFDEEINGTDWDGRPTIGECRLWEIREPFPNHTFECWADPQYCDGDPCSSNFSQEAWPLYNRFSAVPTNVILNQGLGVAFATSGWNENTIRARLNNVVGSTDTCLH
jgi:thiol-disulfide isomerase/thioredoxin